MKVGQNGRIAKIEAQGIVNQRIRDMGIIPGASVTVVGRGAIKDPVALATWRRNPLRCATKEADHISVDLPE